MTSILGTDLPEFLFGDFANNTIFGLSGDDSLAGAAGDDTINGNQGLDFILGGAGNDVLFGGQGDDLIGGDSSLDDAIGGNDLIFGNLGEDAVFGDEGDDSVFGGQGDDRVTGGKGNDLVSGDLGDDAIWGVNRFGFNPGAGEIDTLTGGSGSDIFFIGDDVTTYYTAFGNSDYAIITDFNLLENDIIALYEGDTYRLDNLTLPEVGTGAGVFLTTAGQNELVAFVQGIDASNLTLSQGSIF